MALIENGTRSPDVGVQIPRGGRSTWTELAIGACLVTVYVVFQTLHLREPTFWDPIDYLRTALQGAANIPDHRLVRIGLVLPVRVGIGLFDFSQAAYYFVPYVAGSTLVVSMYALARMLFGRLAGVIAALLIISNPYVLAWSSQLYPDIPAAAVFTAAMTLLVHAGRRHGRGAGTDRVQIVLLVGVGLLLGWSYLVREFIVLAFPAALVVIRHYRMPIRALLPITVGGLVILVVELGYGLVAYGDPFVRVENLVNRSSPNENQDIVTAARNELRGNLVMQVLSFPRLLLQQRVGLLYLGVLIPAMLVGGTILRDARVRLVLIWTAITAGVVTLLGAFPRGEGTVLYSLLWRYWFPVIPSLIVGGVGGLVVAARWVVRGRRWRPQLAGLFRPVTIVTVAVLVAAVGLYDTERLWAWREPSRYDEFRDWLREEGGAWEDIWAEEELAWTLEMFTRTPFGESIWDGSVHKLNRRRIFAERESLSGGLLAFEDILFEPRYSFYRGVTPDYLIDPPDTWSVVAVMDRGPIVLFDTDPKLAGGRYLLTVGRGGHLAWQTLPQRGSSYPQPVQLGGADPVAVGLTAADRILVIDNAAAYLEPPQGGPVVIEERAVVRVELALAGQGTGDVNFHCFFYEPDDDRALVMGVSAWGPPGHGETVEYLCPVPDGLERPLRVRFGFQAVGPLELEVGPLSARAEPLRGPSHVVGVTAE